MWISEPVRNGRRELRAAILLAERPTDAPGALVPHEAHRARVAIPQPRENRAATVKRRTDPAHTLVRDVSADVRRTTSRLVGQVPHFPHEPALLSGHPPD